VEKKIDLGDFSTYRSEVTDYSQGVAKPGPQPKIRDVAGHYRCLLIGRYRKRKKADLAAGFMHRGIA
jgi:hypothetical protein